MKCPHCKTKLVRFTLHLWQCPSDWTVHEKQKRTKRKQVSQDADETALKASCPIKGCD